MPGNENNVDTKVEGMSYEEQLLHYRAVIGEDGHLTDDDIELADFLCAASCCMSQGDV